MTGLADRLNWNLLVRVKLTAFKKPDKSLFYQPIRYTLPSTTRLLVGVANSKAKSTWIYGGQCRVHVPASPSSTSKFVSQMMVLDQRLTVGKLNLVGLPNLDINTYSIELLPPKYFEEFFHEIWWYDGDLVGLDADIAIIKSAVILP